MMKHQSPLPITLCLTALLGATLSGCVTALSADLRQRGEEVFRHHNQLVSELILFNADVELSDSELDSLELSEAKMIEACKPLNQLAAIVRDGGKTSLSKRASVPKAISRCEQQTQEMEHLLSNLSDATS